MTDHFLFPWVGVLSLISGVRIGHCGQVILVVLLLRVFILVVCPFGYMGYFFPG